MLTDSATSCCPLRFWERLSPLPAAGPWGWGALVSASWASQLGTRPASCIRAWAALCSVAFLPLSSAVPCEPGLRFPLGGTSAGGPWPFPAPGTGSAVWPEFPRGDLARTRREGQRVLCQAECGWRFFLSLPERDSVADAFILESTCCTWAPSSSSQEQALLSSLVPGSLPPGDRETLFDSGLSLPHY